MASGSAEKTATDSTRSPLGSPLPVEAAEELAAPAHTAPDHAIAPAPTDAAPAPLEARPHAPTPNPLWRDELSGRVQKFRRRRARLRGAFDPSTTLDLEFDADEQNDAADIDTPIGGQVMDFGERHRELGANASDRSRAHSVLDEQTLGASEAEMRVLSGAAVQAGETRLGGQNIPADSVEIVLDSGRCSETEAASQPAGSVEPRSLLGRRFLAGLADAGLLLVGGGIFAAIFWAVCHQAGPLAASPANLIALAFVVACLVPFYFGMSVAFTFTTPGLAWMGLEVRNLDGELPTTRDSLWRAFGYLVSVSALFLGFVWALLDADGLTWHDLISETYVTTKE